MAKNKKTDSFIHENNGLTTRREFITHTSALTAGVAFFTPSPPKKILDNFHQTPQDMLAISLKINGKSKTLEIDPRTTLLDALRENLHLTGTKKGCDRGQCGACTVLVDGRRINSCLHLAVMCDGAKITTIEGLGTEDNLHPMQEAFLKYDAFQYDIVIDGTDKFPSKYLINDACVLLNKPLVYAAV